MRKVFMIFIIILIAVLTVLYFFPQKSYYTKPVLTVMQGSVFFYHLTLTASRIMFSNGEHS